MGYCKMTICFEKPFWIALIETEDDAGTYRVAKHTFGPEPTDPEVERFIHEHWRDLRFTANMQVEKVGGTKISHKRMQRIIAREVAANARRGTKAQQALAEAREAHKTEARAESREKREVRQRERFEQKTAKRKQKRRGH